MTYSVSCAVGSTRATYCIRNTVGHLSWMVCNNMGGELTPRTPKYFFVPDNHKQIFWLTFPYKLCRSKVMANVKCLVTYIHISLRWRHNERDGVSNHWRRDDLLNRLFMRTSGKTPKNSVTGICDGNSPVTDEFPSHRTSNAENVSIWWRHHVSVYWAVYTSKYIACTIAL